MTSFCKFVAHLLGVQVGDPEHLKVFTYQKEEMPGWWLHWLWQRPSISCLRRKAHLLVALAADNSAMAFTRTPEPTDKGEAETKKRGAAEKDVEKGKHANAADSHPDIRPPNVQEGLGQNKKGKDLNELAGFILKKLQGRLMLRQGNLWVYAPPCWKVLATTEEAIRELRIIFEGYPEVAQWLDPGDFQKLIKILRSSPHIEVCDNDDAGFEGQGRKINCLDGTIDLAGGTFRRLEHAPEDHFSDFLNLLCDDIINPPMFGSAFENYADHVSNGDPDVRRQLLEMGYLALTGKEIKKFYALLGPSDTGKSVWGDLLASMLPESQVSVIGKLSDVGERFGTDHLAGKQLLLAMDIPSTPLDHNSLSVIKQLTGDRRIHAEKKNGPTYYFTKKPLLVVGSNSAIRIPATEDFDSFSNRLVIIPFSNPVSEQEKDHNLLDKLRAELPYIIHEMVLAGWDLADRNYEVTRTEVPAQYRFSKGTRDYDDVAGFVSLHLSEEVGAGIATKDLYVHYQYDTDGQLDFNSFSKLLSIAIQNLMPNAVKVKRVKGSNDRGYLNLVYEAD